MNAQFDWWLLLVGLVIGAGLTWLVLADIRRRDDDIAADERGTEVSWIVETLAAAGTQADPSGVDEVLRLHRTYLAGVPADQPLAEEPPSGEFAAGEPLASAPLHGEPLHGELLHGEPPVEESSAYRPPLDRPPTGDPRR